MSEQSKAKPEIESFFWKGQKRYRCPLNWESGAKCHFDTNSLDELHKHMAKGNHQRLVVKDPNAPIQVSALSHADEPPAELPVDPEFEDLSFNDDMPTHESPHVDK